jgi:hypothetical protein
MAKEQKKFRASKQTLRYLEVAASDLYHGTQVEAISHALRYYVEDKLHPSDEDYLLAGASVICAECDRPIDPSSRWVVGHYGDVYHEECVQRAMTVVVSADPDYWGAEPTQDEIEDFKSLVHEVAEEWGETVEVQVVDGPRPQQSEVVDEIIEEAWERFCRQTASPLATPTG